MKKIKVFAVFSLFILSTFSLAGCGEKECEHQWINANCTTPKTCSVCGETEGEAFGHSFSTEYLKDETNHWFACSRCDEKKEVSSHIWGAGVVIKNPSETEKGTTLYTCECGQTKEEDIAMLEHVHKFDDNLSYDDTHHWYSSTCGHDDSITKVEHEYNWTTQSDATCENAEVLFGTCECGHTSTKDGQEALSHNYEATYTWDEYECRVTLVCKNDPTHVVTEAMTISNEVTKEPTCIEEGTKLYTASFTIDGVTYTDTKTEKLGMVNHTMNGNECVNCDYAFTEGLEYTLSEDGTYYIVSDIGTTTETEIYIPSEYNNLPVLSIGDNAFNSGKMTKVVIPNGVTSIGKSAFQYCNSLESIIIPNSVTSIGSSAFNQCRSLLSITIPEGLTSIEGATFYQCVLLTSITIPSTVTSIGRNAFYQCYELRNITIPDNVTSIGLNAFFGCTSLQYNTLGNGEYLGNNENPYVVLVSTISKEITKIDIHNDTKLIYSTAFKNCTALTSVTIPDGVTNIGEEAFSGCTSLGNIVIPNSVTSIGGSAFKDCTSLVSITIPNSITSIETRAFYNCSSLASITIHDSVTRIDGAAFYNCTSIENVYFTGSQEQWNAITINSNNSYLTSATITYNYVVE